MIRAAEKNVDMCPAICCVADGEGDTAVEGSNTIFFHEDVCV